jgi:hypothetical protein
LPEAEKRGGKTEKPGEEQEWDEKGKQAENAGGQMKKENRWKMPEDKWKRRGFSLRLPVTYQQPHPPPLFPNSPFPLHPPQQRSRRMIQQQSLPPLLFRPMPLFPLHSASRTISQHREIPLLFSPQPHPQFVAVKSLISNPPKLIIYSVSYARRKDGVPVFAEKIV